MKRTLLAFLLFPFLANAQDISTHIPSRATYIISIDPSAHVRNGDVSNVRNLDMFSRSGNWNDYRVDAVYGDNDLEEERKKAFEKFLSDIFTTSGGTGIDTSRKLFIFDGLTDSTKYWAYLFPLKDETAFRDYVSTKLFSSPQIADRGRGYSAITSEKISVGWTNSYAIILLCDYDYLPYQDYSSYWDRYALIQDSIAAVQNYLAAQQAAMDTVINDSIRAARTVALQKEMDDMREQLKNDTIPEEEYYQAYGDYYNSGDYADQQHKNDSMVSGYASLELYHLMNLDYSECIESVANFRSVQSESVDAVYWYNYGELMRQKYTQTLEIRRSYYYYQGYDLDTSNIVNMWKGSYIASLIRFTGKEATMEQRMYFTPALQEHTKGLYRGKVDKKMFHFVNGQNLMGYVAMSVDMEKFMKFYGSVYRETLQNSFAGIYESYYLMMWDLLRVFLDESTLYNLLDGKFVFAVTDLKPFTSTYVSYEYDDNFNMQEVTRERTEILPEFVFIAGLGKEKKAEQIVDILKGVSALKQLSKDYYLINLPPEYGTRLFLAIKDGMLIITNSEDLMVNHLKNGYRGKMAMKKSERRLGRKSALVAFWDGQRSIAIIRKNEDQNLSKKDKEALDLLAKEINSGTIIGKRSKKGLQRIVMTMTYAESNEQVNGFVRFFRLLNSLYLIRAND